MVNLKLEAGETSLVEDGPKTGEIIALEERETPFHYLDVMVQVDGVTVNDKPLVIKYGCAVPSKLTDNGKLGKLVEAINGKLVDGQSYDVEDILLNKKIRFMTLNEETERGTFARIVDGSIKNL